MPPDYVLNQGIPLFGVKFLNLETEKMDFIQCCNGQGRQLLKKITQQRGTIHNGFQSTVKSVKKDRA